jgi:hypothetical protein
MQRSLVLNAESQMQKLMTQNDYLIFFSLETTHDRDASKTNYRKLIIDYQLDSALQALQ